MLQFPQQWMLGTDFGTKLIIRLRTKLHYAEIVRRKPANHFDAVMNRRRQNVLWIVQIKSCSKSLVCQRGDVSDELEEAKFEAAIHVREDMLGLFSSVLNNCVAAIFK